jgi:hypothetical protein
MTEKEHRKWLRWFLRVATKEVKRRDWLAASEAYRAAAYHRAILSCRRH